MTEEPFNPLDEGQLEQETWNQRKDIWVYLMLGVAGLVIAFFMGSFFFIVYYLSSLLG